MKENKRHTTLAFRKGGFYTSSSKTTNIFDDPQYALRNLLECIFYKDSQAHLVDLALCLLDFIKNNGSISTTDFWKQHDRGPKTIGGAEFSYSNFQSILLHLKQAGMITGKKFGKHVLSRDFSFYLDKASDCWRRFFLAGFKLEEMSEIAVEVF